MQVAPSSPGAAGIPHRNLLADDLPIGGADERGALAAAVGRGAQSGRVVLVAGATAGGPIGEPLTLSAPGVGGIDGRATIGCRAAGLIQPVVPRAVAARDRQPVAVGIVAVRGGARGRAAGQLIHVVVGHAGGRPTAEGRGGHIAVVVIAPAAVVPGLAHPGEPVQYVVLVAVPPENNTTPVSGPLRETIGQLRLRRLVSGRLFSRRTVGRRPSPASVIS